jgi:hypothetical protein
VIRHEILALGAVVTSATLCGCASERPPDEELKPSALKVAQELGSSQLGCPAATAQVMRQETIQEPQGTGWYEPPHRAEFTVGVSGCGRSTTFIVRCDERSNACDTGPVQEAAAVTGPELADALRPGALEVAQKQGASELGCSAAKAEVRRQETLQEPQGTGWYEPPHRAVYTVDVAGCGKRTAYLVACDDRKKPCTAGGFEEENPANAKPQLADELQPGAIAAAQQRGVSELGCSAATAQVLRAETIQEPQGTGWYEPPYRAVYTVQVSGCGKRTTYLVGCNNRQKRCEAGSLRNDTSE